MKNPTTPKPSWRNLRRADGFSLLELLIVVAALSSVAAMGFMGFADTGDAVKAAKLRQDVAAINSAVKTYLVYGGDLSAVTDANAVLAKLKTTTDPSSRNKIAGLRGTMLDLRLRGVTSTARNEAKAVWNQATQSFEVRMDGTGFREFILDPSAVPSSLKRETRKTALAMNGEDKWIWAFNDGNAAAAAPRMETTSDAGMATISAAAVPVTVLRAPEFSKPGAVYDHSAFNPDLKVSLVDRNPAHTADLFYSIAHGPWLRWTGAPLSIPRALSTEVRAYSAPLDADRFERSAEVAAIYETIFFGGSSAGLFSAPKGDPGLISNLNGGKSNSFFSWGSPANNSGFNIPNSLTFSGRTFSHIAPDQLFELGTLTYYNGTTFAGTNATSVQLTVSLNLTTQGVVETLPFTFELLSTTNTKEAKEKDRKNKETEKQMDDADADFVYIPDVSTKFSTTIKGKTFYLVLSFGSNSPNGFTTIDEFHVHENKTMTGSIFGKFTTVPPLP
jgi:prepilin-type N-terminal cleavage/methylation domain-containing protein